MMCVVCNYISPTGNIKVHFQFWKLFLKSIARSSISCRDISKLCFKFLDALDHLWNHPGTVEDVDAPATPTLTEQNQKRAFFLDWVIYFQPYSEVVVKVVTVKASLVRLRKTKYTAGKSVPVESTNPR